MNDKVRKLNALKKEIYDLVGGWCFPSEDKVQGFMGTGDIFIVGDQPSTNKWPENNPNRRCFYSLLDRIGIENAHITDVYKIRGRAGALRRNLPADFEKHLEIFREEVKLLNPRIVIALGYDAETLLRRHVPEINERLARVWHFAYVTRFEKRRRAVWQSQFLEAMGADKYTRTTVCESALNQTTQPCTEMPTGSGTSCVKINYKDLEPNFLDWTGNDDSNRNHNGRVRFDRLSRDLCLHWKENGNAQPKFIGCYRLNLRELLQSDYIRKENERYVRLRFYHDHDDHIYIQKNLGSRLCVGVVR